MPSSRSITVLHVDDSPDLADLVATYLQRDTERLTVETATSASDGLDRLSETDIDCVVSDYDMPGQNGLEFLQAVRTIDPELPFILYTGKGSEEIASEAISSGVTDYLQKEGGAEQYTILANRIKNAVDGYRVEREANRTRTQLQAIANNSGDAILMIDPQSRIQFSNPVVEDYFGYTPAELQGEPLTTIMPERHHDEHLAAIDQYLETGERSLNWSQVEFPGRHKDGTEIPLSISFSEFEQDGERRFIGIMRDVSERIQMEKQREQIIERVTDAIVEVDADWRFTLVNDQAEDLYDMPAEELLGQDFWDVFEEARGTRFEEEYRQVMATRDPTSFVEYFSQLDGWFDIEAYPKADGGIAFYFVDVTEQRERQAELEQTNALLSTLFDTFPVGVLAEDAARNVLTVNERLCELFEFPGTPEDVVGTDCERLAEQVSGMFVHPAEFVERTNDLVATRDPVDNEELSMNDGRTIERSYRPVRLPSGDGHLWMYRDITHRKERERRHNAIFNNTYQFTGLLEPDGTLIEANETALAFGGLDREDVLGKKMWEAYWFQHSEDTATRAREAVERAANGEFVREELPVQGATGEVIIDFSVRPLTDERDNVTLLIPEGRDITEFKEQERVLRETKRRLDLVLEGTETGIWEWNLDTDEVDWNETLERAFGLEPGSFEGTYEAFAKRVHPDDLPQVEEEIEQAIETDEPYQAEFRMIRDDGETVWAEAQGVIIDEVGQADRMVGLFRDITDRKERESRLRDLNEKTHRLMTADSRERISEIGVEAAAEILGLEANAIHLYDEEQASLVPVAGTAAVSDLVGELPSFTEGDSIAWRVYDRGAALALDDVHDDPDVYNPDSPIRSELYLPLDDHGILIAGSEMPNAFDRRDVVFGEILAGAIAVALEQVKQTAQLRTREEELTRQNERLEEFTSIVSHDLRNPLSVAEGRLELVQDESDSAHLDDIARAHDRMNVLIEDLLTLAREGDVVGESESVDLGDLIENCWENVDTLEAKLTTDVERPIEADQSRLQQLLENLMRNAVEHGGADVRVTIGELDDGFYVADSGPGIPENKLDDEFGANDSTSEERPGFGLSIVKQVAEAHGWDVRVTEGADGGARFEFTGLEFPTV